MFFIYIVNLINFRHSVNRKILEISIKSETSFLNLL